MKTVVGLLTSTYDLQRAILALQQVGFGPGELHFSYLRRSRESAAPHGPIAWLQAGGFLGDTMNRSDAGSLLDGTAAGATIFSLLGVVYGSAWRMGPITGGVLGILGGGLLGWLCDQLIGARRTRGSKVETLTPDSCLIVVDCADDVRLKAAEDALRDAQAVLSGTLE